LVGTDRPRSGPFYGKGGKEEGVDAQRHAGKVVLITGAGSGMGRATALRFADEGAESIYLVDHFEDRLERVAKEVEARGAKATSIRAELADPGECVRTVREAVAAAGRLDVVISNAAAWTEEPFLEMKLESWQKVIAVDLTASFLVGQEAARAMVERGTKGVILFTASISSLGASPDFAHYGAAKAGTVNLVALMAIELASHGIRVNAISPGPTDTQQSVDLVGEERMADFRQSFPVCPMNRLGTPDEMAATFSFLASDDASFITGHNLVVDGGLTALAYALPAGSG
jgi:NAD(P)-dependent dehydrogenase (short-subunit alcohol dehydrogenase family)